MEIIRPSTPADAESLAGCIDAVARERRFLAALTGFPVDSTREFIRHLHANGGVQLVAVVENRIIGWCDIQPGAFEGMRHSGRLGMGILSGFRGRGIGRRLLREAIRAARDRGLLRVDLEVFETNEQAIALYESEGFECEGVRKRARILDGRTEDLLLYAFFTE